MMNNYFNNFLNFALYNNINKFNFNPVFLNDKTNYLDFFKKGGTIKIKEKNKGSFTKYCKGKVTTECIKRGKNSNNSKIRKKAIFAENARKWKHYNGGVFARYNINKLNNLLNDIRRNV